MIEGGKGEGSCFVSNDGPDNVYVVVAAGSSVPWHAEEIPGLLLHREWIADTAQPVQLLAADAEIYGDAVFYKTPIVDTYGWAYVCYSNILIPFLEPHQMCCGPVATEQAAPPVVRLGYTRMPLLRCTRM